MTAYEAPMEKPFSLWSKNFILACVSCFLYFGSFYLLLPTLPQFVVSLGGSTSQIGIVMAALTLTSVLIRPFFGRTIDKHGRKGFMVFGTGLFAFMFIIYGQVHSIIPLCIARVIHGVAHGSYLAAVYAYVADLAPMERRGEVMGVYGVSNVVSMALFPAIGGAFIAQTKSFPMLFLISFIIGTGGFVATCFMSEIKAAKKTQGPALGFGAPLRQRAVLVASLALFSAATLYGSVVTFLPVYAPNRGLNNVGAFFTAYAVFTLVSRLIAGKMSDRLGRRKVVIPFLLLVGLAAFLFPFLKSIYLLMAIGACYGLGFGAFMPALNAYVVDETSPQQRASALAFFSSFMDIGITTGAMVLGIVGQYMGYETMYVLGGLIVVAGTILFAVSGKATKSTQGVSV
jgi:MFS family permease